ncbi:unnamed protein product [Bursaphelenchus xylophilus]|uniref:(pine wood nematode) hypothetical protein n=1 Tax=Bursaphelenchus xylophilus TaxID=6326 RepID=A0A1I7SHH9_BURXY|nr:unnamed protein product [Bursaphelenchus xylophilus]CAG9120678.1 unnamed protein product [Bursaphelenchus xylophilus]
MAETAGRTAQTQAAALGKAAKFWALELKALVKPLQTQQSFSSTTLLLISHRLPEKFITIGNCTVRGDEEVLDHEKLCSACQGIFVMSSDCFPSFLNAVNCGKDDGRCIFDHFTGYAQGKCMSKTLSFKVMHNRGTKDCEEWEFVYIDIPVACECFLSKTSFLDTIPNEDSQ